MLNVNEVYAASMNIKRVSLLMIYWPSSAHAQDRLADGSGMRWCQHDKRHLIARSTAHAWDISIILPFACLETQRVLTELLKYPPKPDLSVF